MGTDCIPPGPCKANLPRTSVQQEWDGFYMESYNKTPVAPEYVHQEYADGKVRNAHPISQPA